jgi:hypothetical protein
MLPDITERAFGKTRGPRSNRQKVADVCDEKRCERGVPKPPRLRNRGSAR